MDFLPEASRVAEDEGIDMVEDVVAPDERLEVAGGLAVNLFDDVAWAESLLVGLAALPDQSHAGTAVPRRDDGNLQLGIADGAEVMSVVGLEDELLAEGIDNQ